VGRSGRRMGITVFHMEAGNRCFDANVPEEVNRRIIDHDADINLANAEHARRNLLTEGLHPMRIYVTGSPMWDVLEHFDRRMRASDITNTLGLEAGRFFLVSMHREENVDNETHLSSRRAPYAGRSVRSHGCRVDHTRTRVRLDALGITGDEARLVFLEPFGFFDYNALQLNARCTISDSGT
jgi:UDP-N-acetyl-L-fucosamine synthase